MRLIIILLLSSLSAFGLESNATAIVKGRLNSNMDGNGFSITNVGIIRDTNGNVLGTGGGSGVSIAAGTNIFTVTNGSLVTVHGKTDTNNVEVMILAATNDAATRAHAELAFGTNNVDASKIYGTIPDARLSAAFPRITSFDVMAFDTNANNVGLKYGVAGHLNMDKLFRFHMTLQNSNRPVRLVFLSDLGNLPWSANMKSAWVNLMASQGGLKEGGGSEGDFGLASESIQFDSMSAFPELFTFTGTIYRMTNATAPSRLTYSRISTKGSPGLADTNYYADTLKVFYLAETNTGVFGGTVQIQTNIAGTGWGTWKTLNCADFSTNLVITNLTMPLNYYSVRLVNVTKTNRIWGASLYNSTQRGIVDASLGLNAAGIADILAARTNITWPFYSAMNPDLFVVLDTGPVNTPENASVFEYMLTNCCPNSDLLYIGNHYVDAANESVTAFNHANVNFQFKTNAYRYGRAFCDPDIYIGTNMPALTNAGLFVATDLTHPTLAGADYFNSELTRDLLMPSFMTVSHFNNGTNFNGNNAGVFNSTKTNWLGIGTATPVNRFTVFDGSQIGNNTFSVGAYYINEMAIWLNGRGGYLDTSFGLRQASDDLSTMLNASSGGNLYFGIGAANKMMLYPSGGLDLGNFDGDPGAGNILLPGLTASKLVMSGASKILSSVTLGAGLSLSGSTLSASCGPSTYNSTQFSTNQTANQLDLISGALTTNLTIRGDGTAGMLASYIDHNQMIVSNANASLIVSNDANGAINLRSGATNFALVKEPGTITLGYLTGQGSSGSGTVAGGVLNSNRSAWSFIGGGNGNVIQLTAPGGVIVGGETNVIGPSGVSAGPNFIGGGDYNYADGSLSVIGGGWSNAMPVNSKLGAVIAGGYYNTNSGSYSVIPGGMSNTVSGDYAFAVGRRANAANNGAFVFSDSQDSAFSSPVADWFGVRAQGGVLFELGTSTLTNRGSMQITNSLAIGTNGPIHSTNNFQVASTDNRKAFEVNQTAGKIFANVPTTFTSSETNTTLTADTLMGTDAGKKKISWVIGGGLVADLSTHTLSALGDATLVPTTITQTNFVLNTVYTNTSGVVQDLNASCSLTVAAVTGDSSLDLMVDQTGGTTFSLAKRIGKGTQIAVTTADTFTNCMAHSVSNLATYYFTNSSTGIGNSAAIVPGTGQIVSIGDGSLIGITNTQTGVTLTGTFSGNGAGITNQNYACFYDQKTAATDGDNIVPTSTWTNAILNTTQQDSASAFTLSSNSNLTVNASGAGRWKVRASIPFYAGGFNGKIRARLRRTNNTAATLLVSQTVSSTGGEWLCLMTGSVVLAAGDVLNVQGWSQGLAACQFGKSWTSDGEAEVYSMIEFERQ